MQPPQPPRGMFPGAVPPPLGRTNPGMPSLGQSSFGQPPMGAPLPPGPPPGMGGLPMGTAPGLAPLGGPSMPGAPGGMPGSISGPMVSGVVRRQPVFRGYRRMKRGQMYTMAVTIEAEGGGKTEPTGSEPQVTVQPVIPGAMVTPNTYDILLQPGAEAVFSVLPMATGKLAGSRIEILRNGRKLTSLNVPMRVQRGRFMTFMVVLTLLALLLVWWPWQPKWTHVQAPKPGAAPALSPDGNPLPPPQTVYEGAEAIEKYIDVNAGRLGYGPMPSENPLPKDQWSSFDFLAAGLTYVKPALLWLWRGVETIRKTPLGDLYLIGSLAAFALLVSFIRRPRKTSLPGPMLEVRA